MRNWIVAALLASLSGAAMAAEQNFGAISNANSDITYHTVTTVWDFSLLKINTDSAIALVVEQAAGQDVFTVDTSTPRIIASGLRLSDTTDVTKTATWDLSAITTGTDRTITMPDQAVDLTPTTGTFAGVANPVFTGQVSIPAGTALLPGLIPTGDPNTGLWAPAADTLALSTLGVERLRVDSIGAGINCTPTADSVGIVSKLSVAADAGQGMLSLRGDTGANWNGLLVHDLLGNIYIHTTYGGTGEEKTLILGTLSHQFDQLVLDPNATVCATTRLTVGSTLLGNDPGNHGAGIQIHKVNGSATAAIARWSADASPARITLGKSRVAEVGNDTILVTGDQIGSIDFHGNDGVDFQPNGTASGKILVETTGTVGADRIPTAMSFWTATDTAPSVLTKAVAIANDGDMTSGAAGSWALQNVAASSTVPTICPDSAGTATGWGGDANTALYGIVNSATKVTINATGVGIGMTPVVDLDIYKSSLDGLIRIRSASTGSSSIVRVYGNLEGSYFADLKFDNSTVTGTLFGLNRTNLASVITGSSTSGLVIGTGGNVPVILGANNSAIMRLEVNNVGIGVASFAGTNLAKGLVFGNGTAASAGLVNSVQLWAADAGGLAGHSGLHMRGEDDASNLVVCGYAEESGTSDTGPTAAHTPGTIVEYDDTDDNAGDGTYILKLDGTTWLQLR